MPEITKPKRMWMLDGWNVDAETTKRSLETGRKLMEWQEAMETWAEDPTLENAKAASEAHKAWSKANVETRQREAEHTQEKLDRHLATCMRIDSIYAATPNPAEEP